MLKQAVLILIVITFFFNSYGSDSEAGFIGDKDKMVEYVPDTLSNNITLKKFADSLRAESGKSYLNSILGDRFKFPVDKYLTQRGDLQTETKTKKIKSVEKWEEGYSDNKMPNRTGYPHWICKFDTLGNLVEYRSGYGRDIKWETKYILQYHLNGQIKLLQEFNNSNELLLSAEYLNDSICLKRKQFDDNQNTELIKYKYDSNFRLIEINSIFLEGYGDNYNVVYKYNDNGDVLSFEKTNETGETLNSVYWKYNQQGKRDSILYFNKRGKLKELQLFYYFGNGNLKQYSFKRSNKNEMYSRFYKYDSLERNTALLEKYGNGNTERFEWVYNRNETLKQIRYYKNGNPSQLIKYFYNENDQLITVKDIFFTNDVYPRQYLWRTTKFTYTGFGDYKRIEIIYEDYPGIIYNYYYEYY